ncbi:MAG: hypothetical protein Fur0012_04470 [Elusimicrobiota bacterium]
MKLELGLCTCLKKLSLSVSGRGKIFTRSVEYLNQEEIIFPEIKKLASKAGGSFRDFATIVSVNGPGRFTGMRISYTLASVYSMLSGARVYAASVLDCLAYNVFSYIPQQAQIAAISRAFKDEFYLAFYEVKKGRLRTSSQIFWLKDKELSVKLKGFEGLIVGEKEDYEEIYSVVPPGVKTAEERISRIMPEKIVETGIYFARKDFKPLYIKPAKYESIK